jgi:hypothetical protein
VLVLRALASAAEVDPTSCRSLADLEAAAQRGGSMSTPNYLTRATAL